MNLPSLRSVPAIQEPEETGISRELIKEIAAEIGRGTVAYIEVMYPEAIKATSSTFTLSVKNYIYDQILSISELHDELSMRERIASDAKFRKEWVKAWRKIRKTEAAK